MRRRGIERRKPRVPMVSGAAEGYMAGVACARCPSTPRRRRPWHAHKPFAREPGDLYRRPASRGWEVDGKAGAIAANECDGEVGLAHGSGEAGEQGGLG